MTKFFDSPVELDKLLTQLKQNKKSNAVLMLQNKQLDSASEEKKLAFLMALEKNDTLNYLSIESNYIDTHFIYGLVTALRNNTTLTTLYYDKKNLPAEPIVAIQRILNRNRKLACVKTIDPKVIPVPEFTDYDEMKLVAFAAATEGEIDLLNSLVLKNSELLHEVDFIDRSLLHVAAYEGQVDCVKLLLQLGADINFNPVDCIGTQVGTALRRAVENNHHAIVQLLLKAGASVSEKANGFTPLHYVEDVEIAQLLLDHQADIHAVCSNETKADMCRGNSVLHSVLHLEGPNPELIRFLIKNGAKINVVNDAGESPIHTMVMATRQTAENFSRNLSILINAGANPYLEDIKGRTPLGLAQLVRSPWVTLLEQGIEKYALNEAVKLLRKVQSHASFLSLFSFQQSASVSGLGESSRAVKRPKR